MAYDDAPLYYLDQALSNLDQDWRVDFADPWEALEEWFIGAEPNEEVLERIAADVELLLVDEPDPEARLAHFPHTGLPVDMFDDFLRAIRKRALDGLAGNPEPMRAP